MPVHLGWGVLRTEAEIDVSTVREILSDLRQQRSMSEDDLRLVVTEVSVVHCCLSAASVSAKHTAGEGCFPVTFFASRIFFVTRRSLCSQKRRQGERQALLPCGIRTCLLHKPVHPQVGGNLMTRPAPRSHQHHLQPIPQRNRESLRDLGFLLVIRER